MLWPVLHSAQIGLPVALPCLSRDARSDTGFARFTSPLARKLLDWIEKNGNPKKRAGEKAGALQSTKETRRMRRLTLVALLVSAVALSLGATAAYAQSGSLAPLLFNTGVDANKAVLPVGAADPHYTLISVPSGPATALAMSNHPAWIANSAASLWIGPLANGSQTSPVGLYRYIYTIDLSAYDSSTAIISGRWSTDNDAVMMLNLNGVSSTPSSAFQGWTPFTLSQGFVSGVNTLEFLVTNGAGTSGNPTGLRVEFLRGEASSAPVPEPMSMMLAGLGLGAVARLRGRR